VSTREVQSSGNFKITLSFEKLKESGVSKKKQTIKYETHTSPKKK
jgi:hypothetical protein